MIANTPQTETELLNQGYKLAGLTLANLAKQIGEPLPSNLLHAKGWIGQSIETYLGATAGCKSEPDFQELAIELKTIPVKADGAPRETTYVCNVPMLNIDGLIWHDSIVYKKLAHVFWVPIEADPSIPIADRKIGMPLLWSPTTEQEKILRQDWEELMEMVCLGNIESMTARYGVYLQIRPKAANSRARTMGIGATGERIQTLPRGFYLRTSFTKQILQAHYI